MVQDVQVKWLLHGTTVSVVWVWHQDQKLEVSWLYRYKHVSIQIKNTISGCEINFFSDSHLAPKFFKVVANSKKVGHHF